MGRKVNKTSMAFSTMEDCEYMRRIDRTDKIAPPEVEYRRPPRLCRNMEKRGEVSLRGSGDLLPSLTQKKTKTVFSILFHFLNCFIFFDPFLAWKLFSFFRSIFIFNNCFHFFDPFSFC